ncbi:coiled-coil protein [Legionella pneumophila str. Leg01/53]|nr:coiled-coil protein [Legionella pneumophila str. Leg01/53]
MSLEIYTWKNGSKGLGFTKPVKSMLFGGNVGHAAVELTFPADAKGDELAKKYQDVPGLSISKRTEIVPEKQEDGSYKPKEQVVYFVYFSWWPGHTNGHHINSHREDLESEWRHEPAPKIKPEIQKHLYGENTPAANKTNVTGILISEKTISKVKEFSHQNIKETITIENDPAYQQLKAKEAALQTELQQLIYKGKIYEQELAKSALEQRQPNKDLGLTDAEIVRLAEINKELKRVVEQIKLCQMDFEERYLSVGEPPSSVIRIPTTHDYNAPTFALDTAGILEKMASLAQSTTAYSFYKFNCSTSATQVVKAGISDELKKYHENGWV